MTIGVSSRVQLQSGGQEMTVDELKGEQARCLWHDETGRLQSNWINLASLKLAPEPMVVTWFRDPLTSPIRQASRGRR